jgi:hypothetical protein
MTKDCECDARDNIHNTIIIHSTIVFSEAAVEPYVFKYRCSHLLAEQLRSMDLESMKMLRYWESLRKVSSVFEQTDDESYCNCDQRKMNQR